MRPLHKLILLLAIAANDAYRNQIVRQGVQHDSHLTHTYYECLDRERVGPLCAVKSDEAEGQQQDWWAVLREKEHALADSLGAHVFHVFDTSPIHTKINATAAVAATAGKVQHTADLAAAPSMVGDAARFGAPASSAPFTASAASVTDVGAPTRVFSAEPQRHVTVRELQRLAELDLPGVERDRGRDRSLGRVARTLFPLLSAVVVGARAAVRGGMPAPLTPAAGEYAYSEVLGRGQETQQDTQQGRLRRGLGRGLRGLRHGAEVVVDVVPAFQLARNLSGRLGRGADATIAGAGAGVEKGVREQAHSHSPPITVSDLDTTTFPITGRVQSLTFPHASASATPPQWPEGGDFFDTWFMEAGASSGESELIASVSDPGPTQADLAFISVRALESAINAGLAVRTEIDAREFMECIGLNPLVATLCGRVPVAAQVDRVDAVKCLCKLSRSEKALATDIAVIPQVVQALCEMLEAPMRFRWSKEEQNYTLRAQAEAVALVQRLVRSSNEAVESLKYSDRLRRVLHAMVQQDTGRESSGPPVGMGMGAGSTVNTVTKSAYTFSKKYKVKRPSNTTVVEYVDLRPSQMARVALAGLGGVPWRPKVAGQRGLRILSLDGGGTRGVLSIAYLKEIMRRVNTNQQGGEMEPHQMFDLICGTSTGGVIAYLLGAQRASLASTEVLYDSFIEKVFGHRSNLRLVTDRAAYDEAALEALLFEMCGDQLLLDSWQRNCTNFFCISTKVNTNPPQTNIWRNYNYPPGQKSRYPGACRVNTFTAVRATTAAPTFFTPVPWENGLYVDGALVANNPTAVAIQEAKVLFPGVPIEMIVSIGTGYVNELKQIDTMGWDLLVNQLVASSTATEDTHALLNNLLPKEMYFRFNPQLSVDHPIDEKDKGILAGMKQIARDDVASMETGPEAKEFRRLIRALGGQ